MAGFLFRCGQYNSSAKMHKVFHCIATQIWGVGAKLVQLPSVALKPKSHGKQSSEVAESPAYQGKLNFIANTQFFFLTYIEYISHSLSLSQKKLSTPP